MCKDVHLKISRFITDQVMNIGDDKHVVEFECGVMLVIRARKTHTLTHPRQGFRYEGREAAMT